MWKFRKRRSWPFCDWERTKIELLREFRRLLPGLLISLVSLAVVFNFVDLPALAGSLRQADHRLIIASVAPLIASLAARGMAWRTLLLEQASFDKVFFAINEGYLLNNVLPFRLGELGRAFLLGQNTQLKFWRVFSTIMIERAFDIALSAGLLFSTLPYALGYAGAPSLALGAVSAVALGLLALHLMARNRVRTMSAFEHACERLPVLARVGRDQLEAFLNGLAVLVDVRRFLLTLGWMALVWGLTIVGYYLILLAFSPTARLLWAAFGLAVLAMGVSIPSSPASLGVFEAALVGALTVFSVEYSTALAYAVTAHLLTFLFTAIFGVMGLARDGQSLGRIYREVRQGVRAGR